MNASHVRLLAAALLVAFASTALAQQAEQVPGSKLYRWVGPDGKTHYSDDLPQEALTQARQELSKNSGLTLKNVERSATPEERAASRAKAEADAKAEAAMEKTRQGDQMLLSSYPSEAELKRAYDDRLAQVAENLKTTRMSLSTQQDSMSSLLGAASNMELGNKPVPVQLATSIKTIHSQILEQLQAESQAEAQAASLKQEAAKTIGHYRELRTAAANAAAARSAPPPSSTPPAASPPKG